MNAIKSIVISCSIIILFYSVSGMTADQDEWEKVEAKPKDMRNPLQMPTPAVFYPDWARTMELGEGAKQELGFSRETADAEGNTQKRIYSVLRSNGIWVDTNADGKESRNEFMMFSRAAIAGPFKIPVSFSDGTSTKYSFYMVRGESLGLRKISGANLQNNRPHYKVKIMRAEYREALYKGKRIMLFDDNGNGRYDDVGKDSILIDRDPVTLIGKYISINQKLYELLVHPAGLTIEIKPANDVKTGYINLFGRFAKPQKSATYNFPVVIVGDGTNWFGFNFSPQGRARKVPPGNYKILMGYMQKKREEILLKTGKSQSFAVEAGKVAAPEWGGPISAEFTANSSGSELTVTPPKYEGLGGEEYVPMSRKHFAERAGVRHINQNAGNRNPGRNNRNNRNNNNLLPPPQAFPVRDDGTLENVTFKLTRNEDLVVWVTYQSGILGTVKTEKTINFKYVRGR